MDTKTLPFSASQLDEITQSFSTPFHIYDEKGIVTQAESLLKAFAWNKGFTNYFAVKTTPNPFILKVLKSLGFGMDCSSMNELLLCEKIGITGEQIMFTSNNTSVAEFKKAKELGVVINLDDISHIPILEQEAGIPELISARYNPGKLPSGGNVIIGNPEEAKFGCTKEQLLSGFKILKEKGVKRFGLHTMVASNELDTSFFVATACRMFELALEVKQTLDVDVEFINLGGGIGIPYKPEDKAVDLAELGQSIEKAYEEVVRKNGLKDIRLCMECGRLITGPFGYLVSRVINKKEIYKNYVGLDATMSNLMRPGMYGAYHHITVVNKQDQPLDHVYDVTGSLCENNDKFAIDRALPQVAVGDLIAIHEAGAHGHSMGFNYNGKLRSKELLLQGNGEVIEIRRAETTEDYFSTLDFESVSNFAR